MQKITPMMWFDNQAEEAANHYVRIFRDGKVHHIARYTEAGPGAPGSVMVVDFELKGQRFTALNGGPIFKFSEAVSYVIHCEDQAEVDYFWAALLEGGGKESQCGSGSRTSSAPGKSVRSNWKISWAAPIGRRLWPPNAMLKMKKIVIAYLQSAFDQIILSLLSSYTANDKIRFGVLRPSLPDGAEYYNKRGTITKDRLVVGDSALIAWETDGTRHVYVLVALAYGSDDRPTTNVKLDQGIEAIAHLFWDFVTSP